MGWTNNRAKSTAVRPAECKIVLFKIASAEQLEGTKNHLIIKVHYIGYLHT